MKRRIRSFIFISDILPQLITESDLFASWLHFAAAVKSVRSHLQTLFTGMAADRHDAGFVHLPLVVFSGA